MTLDEIKACDKPTLTPSEVASAIGADAQGIRIMAHDCPERLGFPVMLCGRKGRTVKIPRIPFLRAMGFETYAEYSQEPAVGCEVGGIYGD